MKKALTFLSFLFFISPTWAQENEPQNNYFSGADAATLPYSQPYHIATVGDKDYIK